MSLELLLLPVIQLMGYAVELNCMASRMAQALSLHHKTEEAMSAVFPSKPHFTTLNINTNI